MNASAFAEVPCDLRVSREVAAGHEFEVCLPGGRTIHTQNRREVGAVLAGYCGWTHLQPQILMSYVNVSLASGQRVRVGFHDITPEMVLMSSLDLTNPATRAFFDAGASAREEFLITEATLGPMVLSQS